MKKKSLVAVAVALVAVIGVVVWCTRSSSVAKYKQLLPEEPMLLSYVDPVEVVNRVNLENIKELKMIPQQFTAEASGLDFTQRIYPFMLDDNIGGVLAAVKSKSDVQQTLDALAEQIEETWTVEETDRYTQMALTYDGVNVIAGLSDEALLVVFTPEKYGDDDDAIDCYEWIAGRFECSEKGETVPSDVFEQLEKSKALCAYSVRANVLIEHFSSAAGPETRALLDEAMKTAMSKGFDYSKMILGGYLTANRQKVTVSTTLHCTDDATKKALLKNATVEKVDGEMLNYVPENALFVMGMNVRGRAIAEQIAQTPGIKKEIRQIDGLLSTFGTTLDQLLTSIQGEAFFAVGDVTGKTPEVSVVLTTEDEQVVNIMKTAVNGLFGTRRVNEIDGICYVDKMNFYFGRKDHTTFGICGLDFYEAFDEGRSDVLNAYEDKLKDSYFYMYMNPRIILMPMSRSQKSLVEPILMDACKAFLVTMPSYEQVDMELYLNPDNEYVSKYLK